MLKRLLSRDLKNLIYYSNRSNLSSNLTDNNDKNKNNNNTVTKVDNAESETPKIYEKPLTNENDTKKQRKVTRKTPFKYYFDDEERDKNKIMFYEQYFDVNTKNRDRENFMSAIEAFRLTNPSKNLYIDFVYGALMKMKDYNAQTHLEAYRKLLELFPVGPLRSTTSWSRENFHFPRHQSAAIQIFEQLERNGLIIDEEMTALSIKVFGDWTHVVRKAKRQLYWMPKFKNANPYPVPSIQALETLTDYEIALAALQRITFCADRETKITPHYIKEYETDLESNWILSAQSTEQKELLQKHNKQTPIFVEGPNITWIRNKMVNYYVMKTDPLVEIKETYRRIDERDENDFHHMHNMFNNPFKKNEHKRLETSVHEQLDGVIYGMCTTQTSSKISVNKWTKILEARNHFLKDYILVYRIKEQPGYVVLQDEQNQE